MCTQAKRLHVSLFRKKTFKNNNLKLKFNHKYCSINHIKNKQKQIKKYIKIIKVKAVLYKLQ